MCEKGSRLKYSSYRTIYLLSNIGNILEKYVMDWQIVGEKMN